MTDTYADIPRQETIADYTQRYLQAASDEAKSQRLAEWFGFAIDVMRTGDAGEFNELFCSEFQLDQGLTPEMVRWAHCFAGKRLTMPGVQIDKFTDI